MCGICGVVGGDGREELTRVERMTAALTHRGPDDSGTYRDEGAVLGHRRLTIIDLAAGRQPLANEDETVWITYNGEIYNYRELRSELAARGHVFRTTTDTEVIVHLYEELGTRCVERLRGMFAFAIWDRRRGRLFAARDRLGQKPFYYAESRGRLLFASEIKGILEHEDIRVEVEDAAVDFYLSLRFVPPPLTLIRGIRKLPAGHVLTWENGALNVSPYWRMTFEPEPGRGEEEWIQELRERVEEAVRIHMVSDVPVGAFLSGGIDSSVIVSCMVRNAENPIRTFSVGSDDESFDETPYARRVSDLCGTRHEEAFVRASSQFATIPNLVRALDEPSDPIAACMYEVARLASEEVKVVLGGDGGDEIFAGFDRYAAFPWVDRYAALPRWFRRGVVHSLVDRMSESFAYKSWTQRIRWLDQVSKPESPGRRYARMTSFFRFSPDQKAWLYGPRMAEVLRTNDAEAAIAEPFERLGGLDTLHKMLSVDSVTRLPEHTLMLTDRLGMAHGLETRAPLLDHELVEFCATMPAGLKIRGGTTKYAMREAARRWLPDDIVSRPKQGFMFPVAHWLSRNRLRFLRHQLLRGPLVSGGWIQPTAVGRLISEHRRRTTDHHVRIWMLLNLDIWLRIYLEKGSAIELAETMRPPAEAI